MPTPLTILHSTPTWLPLTMTWLYNQVRFLPAHCSNIIVCEKTEHLEQFHLPEIYCFSNEQRWRYLWEKVMVARGWRNHLSYPRQIAERKKPDLIHSHFGYQGWSDLDTAKGIKAKHIVSFYGYDLTGLLQKDPRWTQRYRELFERAHLILCEGPHMRQCILDLGCPKDKVRVHALGIDCDSIPFVPRKWVLNEPLKILIAATFREKKGIPYALEAIGRLQQEVPLEITLIGEATNEPRSKKEKQKIEEIISRYQLGPRIRLLGFQSYSTLFKEAYRHQIFLSPSVTGEDGDTEGGAPVSLLDMAATGIPIISTKHCDIPQIILEGSTGLLAEERDVEGLMNQIRWLISHTENWEDMATAGRHHVETRFNASRQGPALAKIYREILG